MDKLGHRWKCRLKVSKLALFESDLLNTNEDIAPQSRRILQTSVNFRNFADLYLRSLKTYHFQTWQAY